MSERVLRGPFLTRGQVARRIGVPADVVLHRPDLLRVSSRWLPEVYFAFQFTDTAVRPGIGTVVTALRPEFDDVAIADWLVRPNPELTGSSPLAVLTSGGDPGRVVAAAGVSGPMRNGDPAPTLRTIEAEPAVQQPPRRRRMPRPAASH